MLVTKSKHVSELPDITGIIHYNLTFQPTPFLNSFKTAKTYIWPVTLDPGVFTRVSLTRFCGFWFSQMFAKGINNSYIIERVSTFNESSPSAFTTRIGALSGNKIKQCKNVEVPVAGGLVKHLYSESARSGKVSKGNFVLCAFINYT